MKKTLLLFAGMLLWAFSAQSQTEAKKDTIVISFANGSQLILLINKQDDIELIKRYDINAMISDLSQEIDNLREDEDITISEEEGDKYLIDKPEVVEKSEFQPEEEGPDDEGYEERDDYDDYDDYDDNDYEVRVDRERKYWPRTRQSINIDIGLNNYVEDFEFPDENNSPYAVKPHGSWYLGINTTYKTKIAGPVFVEWGGGFDWYNFKLDNEDIRFVKTDSIVRFDPDPRIVDPNINIDPIRSKLSLGYIYLKVVPMLDFSYNSRSRLWNYHGDGFRIGLGGYTGFRIASRTKFVYKQNGDKERDRDSSNIYLNNIRYGFRFQVGYRGIDLFMNYDVSPLFSKDRGPELNAFSFGFTL